MYNKVTLLGNLTRDVEIKYSQTGSAIGNVGIATNRKWKTQSGEQKEEVMFIDLTFFGKTAEIANQYLGKGKQVLVDGRLKLDTWTDTTGARKSKHSIVVETMKMIGSRDDNQGQQGQQGQQGYQPPQQQARQQQQAQQGYQPQQQTTAYAPQQQATAYAPQPQPPQQPQPQQYDNDGIPF